GGSRLAHADKIRRKATTEIADMRNDVTPKIRPSWIAMQKHKGPPLPRFDVADLGSCDAYPPTRMRVVRTDCRSLHRDLQSATARHCYIGSRVLGENSLTLPNGLSFAHRARLGGRPRLCCARALRQLVRDCARPWGKTCDR